jgi:DNA-binding transcriptional ArsR family regulator
MTAVAAADSLREANSRATHSDALIALNHPLRRSILRLLFEKGPASSKTMASRISYVSQSSVRSHMDILAMRGLAKREKRSGLKGYVYMPAEETPIGWIATVLILTGEED